MARLYGLFLSLVLEPFPIRWTHLFGIKRL